jgi:hypothetical protein
VTDEPIKSARLDMSEAVAALARIVLGAQSFEDVLRSLTSVTKRVADGALEVSVTIEGRHPMTVASTAAFADGMDESSTPRVAGRAWTRCGSVKRWSSTIS